MTEEGVRERETTSIPVKLCESSSTKNSMHTSSRLATIPFFKQRASIDSLKMNVLSPSLLSSSVVASPTVRVINFPIKQLRRESQENITSPSAKSKSPCSGVSFGEKLFALFSMGSNVGESRKSRIILKVNEAVETKPSVPCSPHEKKVIQFQQPKNQQQQQ